MKLEHAAGYRSADVSSQLIPAMFEREDARRKSRKEQAAVALHDAELDTAVK